MLPHKAYARLLVAVLSFVAAPMALAGSSSPGSLLASIVRAGNSQRSVHLVSVGVSVYAKITMVSDAARDEGIQRITFTQAGKTGHVTVIANASAAYARGDAFTLIKYMEFKLSAAKKYAGTWIKFVKGGVGFSTIGAGVRLASTMNELKPSAPLSALPETTVGGQRVLAIRGRTPPSAGPASRLSRSTRGRQGHRCLSKRTPPPAERCASA